MNTIDAMKQALEVLDNAHKDYLALARMDDDYAYQAAINSHKLVEESADDLREAIKREEAQTEFAAVPRDGTEPLMGAALLGEAQTVEPVVVKCRNCGASSAMSCNARGCFALEGEDETPKASLLRRLKEHAGRFDDIGAKLCQEAADHIDDARKLVASGEREALIANVVATAPKRIYLVIGEDCPADADFDSLDNGMDLDAITWCADKIDYNSIEYVRADMLAADAQDAYEQGRYDEQMAQGPSPQEYADMDRAQQVAVPQKCPRCSHEQTEVIVHCGNCAHEYDAAPQPPQAALVPISEQHAYNLMPERIPAKHDGDLLNLIRAVEAHHGIRVKS